MENKITKEELEKVVDFQNKLYKNYNRYWCS